MNTCLALLMSFGIDPAAIDLTRTYEVPQVMVDKMTAIEQTKARYCAWRYKIKWRVK